MTVITAALVESCFIVHMLKFKTRREIRDSPWDTWELYAIGK